mmetsp:Transcript_48264/g.145891  ORF Transcript_48264/g.145891 Transcript_48264/m.145891 type:complete len:211 (-) Transcript_48264:3533-4165(-)|eukprot:CAMPEP_0113530314 /NCGR_PEP_ID=MMETSP0015_2-20120614/2868_1 /TAXON_ID=2838 /ORGANISM="Odontella" /LENGTH=210 /DNA_ID=CAMNT_0000429017 /DNA_START=314 /DNA_END=946 /DNA_ORIENTATION=+ /assembly_acc=CAM_ASM_000160
MIAVRAAGIARAGRSLAYPLLRRRISPRYGADTAAVYAGFEPGHFQEGLNVRLLAGGGAPRKRAPRRRRMTGSRPHEQVADDDRGSATIPTPVRDRETFVTAANDLLNTVEKAIEPMEQCNDVFVVKRKAHVDDVNGPQLTIGLAPGDGEYTLQIDEDSCTLMLSSPASGNYTYVLCEKSKEWLGMDDGHIFEGMLTRDLIRQCNGLPSF